MFLTGAKCDVFVVAESVYGTTPANPTLLPLPVSSINMGISRDEIVSGKLRRDRNIEDGRLGNFKVTPSIKGGLEKGSWDALIEAAMMGAWTSNVVTVGSTRRSFSLVVRMDLDTDEFYVFKGVEVSSIEITSNVNGEVEISFSFVASFLEISNSISGATFSAPQNASPMVSAQCSVYTDASYATLLASVTQFSIKADNGMEPIFVIGDSSSQRPTEKRCAVTGSMSAYYESATYVNSLITELPKQFRLECYDINGLGYLFEMGKCLITSGSPDIGGENAVIVQHNFRAFYQTDGNVPALNITRVVS